MNAKKASVARLSTTNVAMLAIPATSASVSIDSRGDGIGGGLSTRSIESRQEHDNKNKLLTGILVVMSTREPVVDVTIEYVAVICMSDADVDSRPGISGRALRNMNGAATLA